MSELSLRDAQQFGLAAGDLAVELGVTEQRRAHALVTHLGRLALGVQLAVAHMTVAAGDLERDDDAVTRSQIARLAADFPDDAHRFVPEDVPGFHEWTQYLVEVEVRTADIGRRDLDNGIGGFLN